MGISLTDRFLELADVDLLVAHVTIGVSQYGSRMVSCIVRLRFGPSTPSCDRVLSHAAEQLSIELCEKSANEHMITFVCTEYAVMSQTDTSTKIHNGEKNAASIPTSSTNQGEE